MGTPAVTPDPFAAYGGQATSATSDPFAAYGGKATAPPQKGFLESFSDSSGLSAIGNAIAHPIKTASTVLDAAERVVAPNQPTNMSDNPNPIISGVGHMIDNTKQQFQQGVADYKKSGLSLQTRRDFANAVPIIGPALQTGEQQSDAGNNTGAMGTLLGLGAAALAPKVIPKVVAAVPVAADAIADAASSAKAYMRPMSDAAIVAPEEIQAQKIAQSILPPGGIKPELVQAIQDQAPAVKAYAERTGNPLNTQAEGLKAAQGVAQEGLQHYQEQVLSPVAGRTVALDPANTELGQQATIGDIDSRITKLNKLVNTGNASSAGAALDVLAKSKWTDELQYLRSKLYPALETTTGIPAADIQTLREGYGGEYSLANQLEAAQNARLTRTGAASQGQQTISSKPPSVLEIPGKALQMARGGEQAIADRQFSSAMKGVQPQAPIRPVPPPIDTDAVAANQAAAQQEFLRQQQLEQASQDAAAGRSQAVQTYRSEQSESQRAQAQQEFLQSQQGEQAAQDASAQRGQQASAARADNQSSNATRWASQGYANVVQHLANDPSSGIARADLIKLGQTPQGNSLLTRASSLTPGSPAMRSLVNQINTIIGATQ